MPRVLTPSQAELAKNKSNGKSPADAATQALKEAVKAAKPKKADMQLAIEGVTANAPKVGGKTRRERMREMLGGKLHVLNGVDADGELILLEMPPIDFKVTGVMMKKILGWETESEYAKRMKSLNPDLPDSQCVFPDSVDLNKLEPKERERVRNAIRAMPPSFMFGCDKKNQERVVCWNNDRNRFLDLKRCAELAQIILQRGWAGPSTMESINGESGVVGESGQPLSIQHSGVALLMAIDHWENGHNRWKDLWPEEPFIERLVVLGVSEASRVIDTIDNVRPKTAEDHWYMGDEFRDLIPAERHETTRYMRKAVDLLWARTEATVTNRLGLKKSKDGGAEQYLTPQVLDAFVDRHPKIKQAVRFMFQLNKGRGISLLKLSAGQAATMMYLMGCSTSNIDDYRNADPPSEKQLEWDRWEAAQKFWANLISDGNQEMEVVRVTLRGLTDQREKIVVLAKAWQAVCVGDTPSYDAILPKHHAFPPESQRHGELPLVSRDTFGGVDCCHWPTPNLTEPLTEEQQAEVEARKADEKRKAEAKRMEDKVKETQAKSGETAHAGKLDDVAAKAAANIGKGANGKPLTAKQVQAAQTAKAAKADADKSKLDGPAAADVERSKAKVARKAAGD